jgi:hypothetical protein
MPEMRWIELSNDQAWASLDTAMTRYPAPPRTTEGMGFVRRPTDRRQTTRPSQHIAKTSTYTSAVRSNRFTT